MSQTAMEKEAQALEELFGSGDSDDSNDYGSDEDETTIKNTQTDDNDMGDDSEPGQADDSENPADKSDNQSESDDQESNDVFDIDTVFAGLDDGDDQQVEMEQDVLAAALKLAEPFFDEDDLQPVPSSQPQVLEFEGRNKNRRETANTGDEDETIFSTMVSHLAYIVRRGLSELSTGFERYFCALHLLFLYASKVPISTWMQEDSNSEKFPVPWGTLYRVILVAYRWSSSKDNDESISECFDLFRPDFRFGTPQTVEAFSRVRLAPKRSHAAMMRYGATQIINALQSRCDEDSLKKFNETFSIARAKAVEARSERMMKRALAAVSTEVH